MRPDDDFRCPVCGRWCYTPSLADDRAAKHEEDE